MGSTMTLRHPVTLAAMAALTTLGLPALAATPTTGAQPLRDRSALVVGSRERSHVVVVVTTTGRMMAIHSLRKLSPGTRVRVDGIKWGAPLAGIKWGTRPGGIKWGIKWAKNGTFASTMAVTGRASNLRVRGVVVARNRHGIVLGTRGGVAVVRIALRMPTAPRTTHAVAAPRVGQVVKIPVTISRRGRLVGTRVIVERTTRGAVPLAGTLTVVSRAARTIRISAGADPAVPLDVGLAVPAAIDMGLLSTGQEVAATATVNADGTLRVAEIGPNDSFAAANDPARQQSAPPPADRATLDVIDAAIARWADARTANAITDPGLAASIASGLITLREAAAAGDIATARAAIASQRTLIASGLEAGTVAADVGAEELSLIAIVAARLQIA